MSSLTSNYFTHSSSLLPPRGGRIELLEIRPVRPNQAIILPGVALKGEGMKYESRQHFRSRSGYAQCDGISQYSGSFIRRCHYKNGLKETPKYQNYERSNGFSESSLLGDKDLLKPINDDEIKCRPRTHPSYLESCNASWSQYQKQSSRLFQSSRRPQTTTLNDPPSLDVRRKLDEAKLVAKLRSRIKSGVIGLRNLGLNHHQSFSSSLMRRPHAFGRTVYEDEEERPRPPRYQNYVYVSDEDLSQGMTQEKKRSPRRRRGLAAEDKKLAEKEALSRPTSREGLVQAYDYLFDRHFKTLSSCSNEAVKEAGMEGNESLMEAKKEKEEEEANEEDECSSLSESEQLSLLGNELVERSLEDVTERLLNNLSTKGEEEDEEREKKVTFDKSIKDRDAG